MRENESARRPSGKKRAAAKLDGPLEKRLLSYLAAASAAGVGALCCTPRAQAKVVFTDTWIPIPPVASVTNLDLNNDGIADFQISNGKSEKCRSSSGPGYCVVMKVLPQNASNEIWGARGVASALGSGVTIGPPGKFQAGHEFMGKEAFMAGSTSYSLYRSAGPWRQTTRRFLGLKFIIQGQIHYGWARLSVTATGSGMFGAISGYAYETEPDKPIRTGQENGVTKKESSDVDSNGIASPDVSATVSTRGSLGVLAGGAPALTNLEW